MTRRVRATIALLAACTAANLAAQGAPPVQARALVGIVVDTSGRPVDSAEVRVESTGRSAFSRSDGTFSFENMRVARYTVTARKAGYSSSSIRVPVPSSGASIRFELGQYIRGLPPAVTVATRTGIIGVVLDTAHRPIAGAIVDALGSARQVRTDSAGAFYVDVTAGRYLLRIHRDGYRSQLASVTVPENEGRRVSVWLAETAAGRESIEAAAAFDLNERLVMRNVSWSTLYTREDMARISTPDVNRIVSVGAIKRIDEACDAVIDGGPRTAPLWTLSKSDIEFIEVYAEKPQRRTVTSATPGATVRGTIPPPTGGTVSTVPSRSAAAGLSCTPVYVWLRR